MNYGELKTLIGNTLKRGDLAAAIPGFVTLAHANIDAELRGHIREFTVTLYLSGGRVRLPFEYRKVLNVEASGVKLIPADRYLFDGADNAAGPARYYTIKSGFIEVYPVDGSVSSLEVTYEAEVWPLVDDTDENEVLARFPGVYLYGSLIHSAPFLIEDERLPVWASLYRSEIDKANGALMRESMTPTLQMRPSSVVV